MLPPQGLVDDADDLGLRVEPDNRLRFTIEGANEQKRNASNLEDAGNVGVIVHIDAVEIDLALVVLRHLSQDGREAPAWLAPVSVKIHDDRPRAVHFPVTGAPVGDKVLKLLLINVVDGIDSVDVLYIALGVDS